MASRPPTDIGGGFTGTNWSNCLDHRVSPPPRSEPCSPRDNKFHSDCVDARADARRANISRLKSRGRKRTSKITGLLRRPPAHAGRICLGGGAIPRNVSAWLLSVLDSDQTGERYGVAGPG